MSKGQESVRTDSCDSTMTTDTVIDAGSGSEEHVPTISDYKAKRKAHLLRSESVAGPSGCLSGIYGSLDRRAKLKMMHQQMSMDETRCSFASTSSSTTTTSPEGTKVVPKSAVDRRRKYLLKKQTYSAPDSLEDSTPFTDRLAVTYYLDSVYTNGRHSWQGTVDDRHLLSVSPEPSGLVVQNRCDQPNRPGGPYLNLPSPNVQGEDHGGGVFGKLSSSFDEDDLGDREDDIQQECPSAAALSSRRRALVPPKLLSDGYDSANEELEGSSSHTPPAGNGSETGSTRSARRSSIVVIPPMHICPGDLLVYSKVLTQRNNLLVESGFNSRSSSLRRAGSLKSRRYDLDGSTTSLAVSDDTSRKGKNTFSFLRLFDRSNRSKSESMCGLEEVLNSITPSEFNDDQLSKYKGMQWYDFVTTFEDRASCYEVHIPSPELSSPIRKNSNPGTNPNPSIPSISNLISTLPTTNTTTTPRPNSTTPPLSPSKDQFFTTLPRNEQKRKEAVWDLFQSECMFLYDHLMVLKNVFMEPLKKIQVEGYAMFAEPEVLFGNLDELCCVTYAFCKEFINLLLQDMASTGDLQVTEVLVKLFQKSSKAMSVSQAFHRYSLNYINALNYLETLRRQMEFIEFEKWCQRDPRCKKLQLTDLLVAPVQHIMKIPIILKDIEMRTDNPHDKEVIAQILETEENSLRELDDKMKWLKNFERLLEIQKNITWPSVMELHPKVFIPDFLRGALSKQPCEKLIVSPRRQIILEGPLMMIDSGKTCEMYLILFDDMLLVTRRKKGLHKKKSSITENWPSSCSRGSTFSLDGGSMRYIVYKQPLSLDRFFIHDVSLHDAAINKLDNAFVLVCLNRFQQIVNVYTLQASTDQTKQTWLTKLKGTQDRWKQTLQSTVFRNQQHISSSPGVK